MFTNVHSVSKGKKGKNLSVALTEISETVLESQQQNKEVI